LVGANAVSSGTVLWVPAFAGTTGMVYRSRDVRVNYLCPRGIQYIPIQV
jgi:hypothetical protein